MSDPGPGLALRGVATCLALLPYFSENGSNLSCEYDPSGLRSQTRASVTRPALFWRSMVQIWKSGWSRLNRLRGGGFHLELTALFTFKNVFGQAFKYVSDFKISKDETQ